MIASMHIPKTGGHSVLEWLKRYYSPITTIGYEWSCHENIDWSKIKGDVIHGHFTIDEVISKVDKVITFVRYPLTQVKSNYNFYLNGKDGLYITPNIGVIESDEKISFDEFIKITSNYQSRFIGDRFSDVGVDLSDFFFIGRTEFLNQDLRALAFELGLKYIKPKKIHVTAKDNVGDVDAYHRRLIDEYYYKDYELYVSVDYHKQG
jgi:hypothetical protein